MDVLSSNLTKRFPIREIKTRAGGRGTTLYYVSQDTVVERLNDVFGTNWSVSYEIAGYKDVMVNTRTEGKANHSYVCVKATIRYFQDNQWFTKDGLGADDIDKQSDLDMAIKSAGSSALKKAASYLGVGLYLASIDERSSIQVEMDLQRDNPISECHIDILKRMKALCKWTEDRPVPEKTKNEILSPLVETWSAGTLVHWSDIHGKNIEEFLTWAEKQSK